MFEGRTRVTQPDPRRRRFVREARYELRKVDWPTGREAAIYSRVVLATVAVLPALMGSLDWTWARILGPVFGA